MLPLPLKSTNFKIMTIGVLSILIGFLSYVFYLLATLASQLSQASKQRVTVPLHCSGGGGFLAPGVKVHIYSTRPLVEGDAYIEVVRTVELLHVEKFRNKDMTSAGPDKVTFWVTAMEAESISKYEKAGRLYAQLVPEK